jgi:PBSX family phage terminase large subunit
MEAEIELEILPDAINDAFWPYLRSPARHRLLWGGRDSSKSDFVALDLLLQCLELPYFKCVLVRNVFNTIAESQVATLQAVAEREGLSQFFFFGVSPLEIRCLLNGNKFISRGMDNGDKLKSIKDPTHAWYEEANQIQETDADTLSSTLRTSRPGTVIQEIYTFNPDHHEDYEKFWLWQRFFRDTGNAHGLTFSGTRAVQVKRKDGSQRTAYMPFEVLHTTYVDNRWCPPERAALYESYGALIPGTDQMVNPYRYRVWCQGLWAKKETGNEFYTQFSKARHAAAPIAYLPGLAIYQSWDANSLPYCAMIQAQLVDERSKGGKLTIRVFHEYAIRPPNSGITSTGKQFLYDRLKRGWADSPVYLTGDGSMKNNKTGEQRGETLFNDVMAALMTFKNESGDTIPGCLHSDSDRLWPKKNPGVNRRRDFINYLLAGGLHDMQVVVGPGCTHLIEDLELVQKSDEGKVKEKAIDKVLGVSYEKRGHHSDTFDYLICSLLEPQYEQFKGGR